MCACACDRVGIMCFYLNFILRKQTRAVGDEQVRIGKIHIPSINIQLKKTYQYENKVYYTIPRNRLYLAHMQTHPDASRTSWLRMNESKIQAVVFR